jgi:hypothetical protein
MLDIDLLKELDLASYVTILERNQIGTINLGGLIDGNVSSKLLLGLTNDSLAEGNEFAYLDGTEDSAPADNRLKINLTTMAYSALK